MLCAAWIESYNWGQYQETGTSPGKVQSALPKQNSTKKNYRLQNFNKVLWLPFLCVSQFLLWVLGLAASTVSCSQLPVISVSALW